VHPEDYFYEAVRYLFCAGAISGYGDGTFRPFNNATRGQLTKILVLAQGWPLDCAASGHFSDVPPSDPFFCYIETAYARNIISGYADGTFRPGNNITRGQFAKIVVLAQNWSLICPQIGHFIDVGQGSPFYCYIETAYSRNVISGYADGTFRPGNNATRGQISAIIYRVLTGGAFPTYTPLIYTPTPIGSGTAIPSPTATPYRLPTMTPVSPAYIHISDYSYTPQSAHLVLGGTFYWINNGPSIHTVTSDTGEFNSGPIAPGHSFAFTPGIVTLFRYHCATHPGMTGAISLEDPLHKAARPPQGK
jgi:plastocyanin